MLAIIHTTAKDKKEAKYIANFLLKKKIVACIQMSKIKSLYVWESKIQNDKEILITIKTRAKHYPKIKKYIKCVHSYDTPEIFMYKANKVSKKYMKWICNNT